jgi:hypothetical protein
MNSQIINELKRDRDTRFSTSGFFHESVSPKPRIIPLGGLEFYRKFADVFAVQAALPASLTPVANETNLQSEKFKMFCLDTFGQ